MKNLRKIPPVCLVISLARLVSGRLIVSHSYRERPVVNARGGTFIIFRHIRVNPLEQETGNCVFVVSFKFARLSFRANKLASVVPMLMITGFPGFMQKMYAMDPDTGFWQGMYQWRSGEHLEAYQKSFVFRMMKRRAINGTVNELTLLNQQLTDYLKSSQTIQKIHENEDTK
jgi:hypothetical protein